MHQARQSAAGTRNTWLCYADWPLPQGVLGFALVSLSRSAVRVSRIRPEGRGPQTATTNPSSDTGASVSVLYSAPPDPDTDRATRPSPRSYRKRPWFPWLRPNLTATLD